MAIATGTINGETSNQYISCKLVWTVDEQSIAENYSMVTIALYYSRTNTGYTTSGTWSGEINVAYHAWGNKGTKKISITHNSNTKAMSITVKIPHNSDGTCSIDINADGSISGTTLKSTTVFGVATLPTIPRASTLIQPTNDVITLSGLEVFCPLEWEPKASKFAYKIKASAGSVSRTTDYITPNTTDTYSMLYSFKMSDWAKAMPNNYSTKCTITLYTYTSSSSTASIGSSSITLTLKLPTTMKSQVTFKDPTLIDGWNGYYIQGKSKCKLSATFEASNGSELKSCSIIRQSPNEKILLTDNSKSLELTTGTLTTAGEYIYKASATDGRSTTSVTKKIYVYPYAIPTLTISAARILNDPGHVGISYKALCSSINNENPLVSLVIYKKLSTEETWKEEDAFTMQLAGYDSSGNVVLSGFARESSYDIKAIVKDTYGSYSAEAFAMVQSEFRLMNIKSNKKGIAFGKMAEADNVFDCGLQMKISGEDTTESAASFHINSNKEKYLTITRTGLEDDIDHDGTKEVANVRGQMFVSGSGNVTLQRRYSLDGGETYTTQGYLQIRDDRIHNYTNIVGIGAGDNYGTLEFAQDEENNRNIMYIHTGQKTSTDANAGLAIHNDSVYVPYEANDGIINLGSSGRKWNQLYAVNSTISTSDRNVKTDIATMSDSQEQLFNKLCPVTYKFINGTSQRTHYGFVSQDVENALTELNLTGQDFAGFCKDIKLDNHGQVVLDENGSPVYNYSLRYSEFIALNTYMIQKLQAENAELKAELQELKEMIVGTSSNNVE